MGVKVEKNDLRKRKLFLEGNILQGVLSLFNSLIAFALVIGANSISRNISDTSLW